MRVEVQITIDQLNLQALDSIPAVLPAQPRALQSVHGRYGDGDHGESPMPRQGGDAQRCNQALRVRPGHC